LDIPPSSQVVTHACIACAWEPGCNRN